MGYTELDLNLSDESRAIQETAAKFALEVMRPAGAELDAAGDPQAAIAKGSSFWDVRRRFRELGFHGLGVDAALGGMRGEVEPAAECLLGEALGYGDAGLAAGLVIDALPYKAAAGGADEELKGLARAFCEDAAGKLVGCLAAVEPTLTGARMEVSGGELVLYGCKAPWTANGSVATHALVIPSLLDTDEVKGACAAVVPLDLHGVRRGKPHGKMGQRSLNHCDIFFDDVKVPKKFVLATDPKEAADLVKALRGAAGVDLAQVFVGLAQSAYDEALEYSKERVQGGLPIFRHQNVRTKLFGMFARVEASRALARRVALYLAGGAAGAASHAAAARVETAEAAFRTASDAVQVFGGNGLAKEYVVEKMFRDARACMIESGVNESLALAAARDL